jgi:hypothetical protein
MAGVCTMAGAADRRHTDEERDRTGAKTVTNAMPSMIRWLTNGVRVVRL